MNALTTNRYLRRIGWRLGRKLYCLARGDLKNYPQINGEYWLLLCVFEYCENANVLLLDVGANKGDWTMRAIATIKPMNVDLSVIAFEPCTGTRAMLESRVGSFDSVQVSPVALASSEGSAEFYFNKAGAGTNSLSPVSGGLSEQVTITTLDAFIKNGDIPHVTMLKIDTEGFDFNVLQGAKKSLSTGCIDIIQFEYNWRWLINHVSLRDVFEFIEDKPYVLGKLVGSSIDIYNEWHFEMDRYFENNYILIKKDHKLLHLGVPVQFDSSNCARRIK